MTGVLGTYTLSRTDSSKDTARGKVMGLAGASWGEESWGKDGLSMRSIDAIFDSVRSRRTTAGGFGMTSGFALTGR